MKYIYYYFFQLQNYRNVKKNILKLKFYINRIFTPENLTKCQEILAENPDLVYKFKGTTSTLDIFGRMSYTAESV